MGSKAYLFIYLLYFYREVNGMISSEPRGAATATPTLGIKPAEGAESSTLSTDDNDPLSSLRRELGLQQNDIQVGWIFETESTNYSNYSVLQ